MSPGLDPISIECNIPSKFVTVKGSKMHYLMQGEGTPILFVHGMPAYSYLWRNIIPELSQVGCCIAVDLIGMGLSDKPDIEYSIFDHIEYLQGFIEKLNLKDIILVVHGWGSVAGFTYACHHEENIRGIAFSESHIRANVTWEMLSLPVQQLATLLERPGASYKAVVENNYLIKKLLPHSVMRRLRPEELRHYEKPFQTLESRKPLWQYVQELPLGKNKGKVVELINHYSAWLQKTDVPKLMLYGIPGFMTTIEAVQWAKKHLSNLTLVEINEVLHFAQETNPQAFAAALKEWCQNLTNT